MCDIISNDNNCILGISPTLQIVLAYCSVEGNLKRSASILLIMQNVINFNLSIAGLVFYAYWLVCFIFNVYFIYYLLQCNYGLFYSSLISKHPEATLWQSCTNFVVLFERLYMIASFGVSFYQIHGNQGGN